MTFNSMLFAVFFAAVVPAYFLTPHRFRWCLLLPASYFFYMCWRPEYGILILFTTTVDYCCGLQIERSTSHRQRKLYLVISIVADLGVLFTFKYFNFVTDTLRALGMYFSMPVDIPHLHVLLPIGISFYTFQSMSYTIDVYRRQIKAERHFGLYALYVSFFPQLVAGPIERGIRLLPQFRERFKFDAERVWSGLQLMGWGLFKKVVIADRLAVYVKSVFNNVESHSGPSYLLATYFFAFQIYCDFSGYSDIAIGAARVMGFDLMENFRRPYFATTIVEFWRRWHISLSTWLRDYLYIPLGGNRRGTGRMYLNLLITMLLGGIWHGAAWTFVIWGALHGAMLCLSKLTLPVRDRLASRLGLAPWLVQSIRMFVTFHLVCLSWVFFRANSVQDAFYLLSHLFHGWPRIFVDEPTMAYGLFGVLVLLVVQVLQSHGSVRQVLERQALPVRWAVCAAVLFMIVLFGMDGNTQFIYFQF
jgi:alginate O-acetyltransferase complex protein AlgI